MRCFFFYTRPLIVPQLFNLFHRTQRLSADYMLPFVTTSTKDRMKSAALSVTLRLKNCGLPKWISQQWLLIDWLFHFRNDECVDSPKWMRSIRKAHRLAQFIELRSEKHSKVFTTQSHRLHSFGGRKVILSESGSQRHMPLIESVSIQLEKENIPGSGSRDDFSNKQINSFAWNSPNDEC